MPCRSKVALLPEELRTEVEGRILERDFSGYEQIAAWLQTQGYRIAHDSLQRYGARLRCKREGMESARRFLGAFPQTIPGYPASIEPQTQPTHAGLTEHELLSLLNDNAETPLLNAPLRRKP